MGNFNIPNDIKEKFLAKRIINGITGDANLIKYEILSQQGEN